MEKFNQLKELVASAETDALKFFENANAAAGTRVRKAMQEAKNLAQDIRKEVIEKKNTK
ncbi:MAG TPA: histone H1 [Anseongella sp.]